MAWSGFSRVGAELATGIVTGGLSTVSKAGKVIAVVDAAGNLVMVGEGVAGAFDCDGWTAGEIFGTLAALAGLGGNAAGALGKWAEANKTVGRWMSPEELAKMRSTGRVQEGTGGQTRVADPANPNVYRNAPPGDVYVEFDVRANRVLPHSRGTGRIPGPNSPDARMPGRNPSDYEMPNANNIREPGT